VRSASISPSLVSGLGRHHPPERDCGSSRFRGLCFNPRSGCQHKAWGEAQRNPRNRSI